MFEGEVKHFCLQLFSIPTLESSISKLNTLEISVWNIDCHFDSLSLSSSSDDDKLLSGAIPEDVEDTASDSILKRLIWRWIYEFAYS